MNKIILFYWLTLLLCLMVVDGLSLDEDSQSTSSSTLTQFLDRLFPKRSMKNHKRYVFWATRNGNGTNDTECSTTDSTEDYPHFIDDDTLANGAIILCFLLAIYCFTFLAIICDSYFLPSVERICEALNLSKDVAAATFMSVATTTPELFVNIIGTFITQSDLGIGTVVGSSLFNALGVASIGSLAAIRPLQLHWWPVTRDSIIYMFAVLLLIILTNDGKIYWYEGLILFVVCFVYFTVMFQNVRISGFVQRIIRKYRPTNEVTELERTNDQRISVAVISARGSIAERTIEKFIESKVLENSFQDDDDKPETIWRLPRDESFWGKLWFFYVWPLKLILTFTIPNPRTYPNLFPLTFVCCILCIGVNSYIVSWMLALIGNLFGIPDAVLGMTFLAAGGCLPEGISITILARRGEAGFGVSNSLGANTMNILLSLGMPWFLKTIMMGANDQAFLRIESGAIEYTIGALMLVVAGLYLTLYFNNFQLRKKTAIFLASIYTVFIILAICSETIFFANNDCD